MTGSLNIQSGSQSGSVVTNVGDGFTDVPFVKQIITLTSASYAALTPKDPNTLYVVSGSATSGGSGAGFPFSGSAQITGSLGVTGSISVTGSYLLTSGSFTGSLVDNVSPTTTNVPPVRHVISITSASYAALVTKDPNTLYVISGSAITGSAGSPFPFTGNAVITGSLIVTGSSRGNIVSMSIASSTASLDMDAGNYFTCLASGNFFVNITNLRPGDTANLVLTTVGIATASFSTNVKQPSGSLYRPTSGSNNVDVLSFVSIDTSNVYLVSAKKFV